MIVFKVQEGNLGAQKILKILYLDRGISYKDTYTATTAK